MLVEVKNWKRKAQTTSIPCEYEGPRMLSLLPFLHHSQTSNSIDTTPVSSHALKIATCQRSRRTEEEARLPETESLPNRRLPETGHGNW
ncbi:hypothetical protein EUGRSUZ_E02277 [Eucalyptus grandis]|uniref:Uncharacterized protein n=2 Tax=Eucalyptus grandis TaxID=71139 RepID=A0ACC3KXS0_EUCGR|nr:hypothetical protein EUGRSUZ_E02277 [Eucalyptus grandis]